MGSGGWTAGRIQGNRGRVSNLVSSGPWVHRGGFLAEFRVSNRGHGFRVTWVHQSSAYCSKVLLIVLKAQMRVAPKYLRYAIRPLPHPFVLYAPWIGVSFLFLGLGQQWPCLDLFP